VRIFITKEFARFARKNCIRDTALCEAAERAENGLVDADLGGGLLKQRVARPGEGRRGGYRTIIVWRSQQRCVFVHGYAKNQKPNLTDDELEAYRRVAKIYLDLTNANINKAVAEGSLIEVEIDDGEEVPQ